jgi:hypothetical protein
MIYQLLYNTILINHTIAENKPTVIGNLGENVEAVCTSIFRKKSQISDEQLVKHSENKTSLFINMLSQYCAISGIKFIWGTWDLPSNLIIQKVKNNLYFSENIDMNLSNLNRDFNAKVDFDPTLNCHIEYKDHPEFHFASDVSKGIEHSHYGLHRHLHFFEKFLNKIREG